MLEDMGSVIKTINNNDGVVMCFLTLIYAMTTIFMWQTSRKSVAILESTAKSESRAYLHAYLRVNLEGVLNHNSVVLVIENLGKTEAKDVNITLAQTLAGSDVVRMNLQDRPFFKTRHPMFPPGYTTDIFVGHLKDVLAKSDTGGVFEFRLDYRDIHGDLHSEIFISDISMYDGLPHLQVRTMNDSVKALENIVSIMKSN